MTESAECCKRDRADGSPYESGAEKVADLEPDQVEELALRLWVIQPGGSFLQDPEQP